MLLFSFIVTTKSSAQQQQPTALFLINAEPQIRLYSMGNIFSAVNPNEAFTKPWMLGRTVNYGFSFSQWPGIIETSKYNYAGIFLPVSNLTAISIGYLNYDAGEEEVEEFDGSVRIIKLEQDHLFNIGYGFPISQTIFCGLSIKYLQSILAEDYNSQTFLFDAGVIYHTLDDKHTIGVSVNNYSDGLIYNNTKESLPTEIKTGYSYKFKFLPRHRVLAGISYTALLNHNDYSVSAGVEYSPGVPFIFLRSGLKFRNNGELQYTAGLGINIRNLNIDVGYGISSINLEQNKLPIRFSLNLLFGPTDEYSVAEAYLKKKNMKDKAIALWKNILPGEPQYTKAEKSIKLYISPPELVISPKLIDDTRDGILSAGENGKIVIDILNKGKSEAIMVKTELKLSDVQKVKESLEIKEYDNLITSIQPGKSSQVVIPVKAKIDAEGKEVEFDIVVTEGRGFNPLPVKFTIPIKPFPPPILVFAKYTFREDNTGNSLGNGNGIIEKGEQVEVTGYVVNAGETVAKDVVSKLIL